MFCWIGASFQKDSTAGGRWRPVVDLEFPGVGEVRCLAQGVGSTRCQVFPEVSLWSGELGWDPLGSSVWQSVGSGVGFGHGQLNC